LARASSAARYGVSDVSRSMNGTTARTA
jgi:hypothetical protein